MHGLRCELLRGLPGPYLVRRLRVGTVYEWANGPDSVHRNADTASDTCTHGCAYDGADRGANGISNYRPNGEPDDGPDSEPDTVPDTGTITSHAPSNTRYYYRYVRLPPRELRHKRAMRRLPHRAVPAERRAACMQSMPCLPRARRGYRGLWREFPGHMSEVQRAHGNALRRRRRYGGG